MTNYQVRGNMPRKKIVKRRRINKVRFSLFILTCLLIIFSLFFGIKSLFEDEPSVEFRLTNDLNEEIGVSSFLLMINWETLDIDDNQEVIIKVNGETYELSANQNIFELELDEPETDYVIEFKTTKKGLGFDNKLKKKIKTSKDNQVLTQEIEDLKINDNTLTFKHILDKEEVKDFNLQTLSYQLTTPKGNTLETFNPEIIQEEGNLLANVSIPLQAITDEPYLTLFLASTESRITLAIPVQEEDKTTLDYSQEEEIAPILDGKNLTLINKQSNYYDYVSHYFYGESLNLEVNASIEDIKTYQLIDSKGNIVVDNTYEGEINKGIELASLEEGQYSIYLNHNPVYTYHRVTDKWYTVLRDGFANCIELKVSKGILTLNVSKVTELPNGVYDILIDPGHGGLDTGTAFNGLLESEEVLKISKYIASRLEDHGLKVKLTRTDDLDPAGKGNFDYNESPYYNEGRVEQAYQYQPKYMISNHLNSFDKSLEGFEVYTSVLTTDEWSELVAMDLDEAGQVARDSVKNDYRVSNGSYKKYYLCKKTNDGNLDSCKNEYVDYLYIIREAGGIATQASTLLKYNDDYQIIPNFGPETMLIEYAYIDNVEDSSEWKVNYKNWGEAVVKATLNYLNIPYKLN